MLEMPKNGVFDEEPYVTICILKFFKLSLCFQKYISDRFWEQIESSQQLVRLLFRLLLQEQQTFRQNLVSLNISKTTEDKEVVEKSKNGVFDEELYVTICILKVLNFLLKSPLRKIWRKLTQKVFLVVKMVKVSKNL